MRSRHSREICVPRETFYEFVDKSIDRFTETSKIPPERLELLIREYYTYRFTCSCLFYILFFLNVYWFCYILA